MSPKCFVILRHAGQGHELVCDDIGMRKRVMDKVNNSTDDIN